MASQKPMIVRLVKWVGFTLFLVLTLVGRLVLSQPVAPTVADCPPGYVCLEEPTYQSVKTLLLKLQKIEENEPVFTFEPVFVIVDRNGRVYSSGDRPNEVHGHMLWGDFDVDFVWTPKMEVHQAVEPVGGWRLRVKAITWFNFLAFDEDFSDGMDFGLGLEPLYYKRFNLQVYAGIRSFGLGFGVDITTNFGVFAGCSDLYRDPTSLQPSLGVYFSFN